MKRILSLRGGGIRGLSTAVILARIERETGKQIHELFDLVAGTSVGGILAAAVSIGISGQELVDFFHREGPKIFRPRFAAKFGLTQSRFKSDDLQESLWRSFGGKGILMAHTLCDLLICTTRYQGMEGVVWKSRKDVAMPLYLAAAMSAAAPTYFDPIQFEGFHYCDGGCWANNPSAVAATEAHNRWPAESVALLDINCPANKTAFAPHRGGIFGVASHLVSLFIGAGESGANKICDAVLDGGSIRRTVEPPLLNASQDIGDASKKNLEALWMCAQLDIEVHLELAMQVLRWPSR